MSVYQHTILVLGFHLLSLTLKAQIIETHINKEHVGIDTNQEAASSLSFFDKVFFRYFYKWSICCLFADVAGSYWRA